MLHSVKPPLRLRKTVSKISTWAILRKLTQENNLQPSANNSGEMHMIASGWKRSNAVSLSKPLRVQRRERLQGMLKLQAPHALHTKTSLHCAAKKQNLDCISKEKYPRESPRNSFRRGANIGCCHASWALPVPIFKSIVFDAVNRKHRITICKIQTVLLF